MTTACLFLFSPRLRNYAYTDTGAEPSSNENETAEQLSRIRCFYFAQEPQGCAGLTAIRTMY